MEGGAPQQIAARSEQARVAEFYETPRWCVETLLRGGGPDLPGGAWLDPCAGYGRIPAATNAVRDDVRWVANELRADCADRLQESLRPIDVVTIGNFFDPAAQLYSHPWLQLIQYEVVIFNSPFSLTLQFVQQAFELGQWIISLQRTAWIGPSRASWLSSHMPDRYVLPRRPAFRLDGQADRWDYEWHVWPPGEHNRETGLTRMLALAPDQLAMNV